MKRRRSYGRICRRPSGAYYIQFVEPGAPRDKNGRRKPTTRSVASKAEGERFLKELRLAILRGTFAPTAPESEPSPTRMIVLDALDQYIEAVRAAGRAASTVRHYESIRRAIAQSALAEMLVTDIKPIHIEKYVAWRRERRWWTCRDGDEHRVQLRKGAAPSNAAINRDLALLSAAFNRLVRLGLLPESPVARVKHLKENKKPRCVLSKEEAQRLLDACSESFRPLVLAGLLTGARAGELIGLTWGDISFSRKTISLYRTKTGTPSVIPLHPTLGTELKRIKKERSSVGKRIVADSEPVFLSERGTPYRYYRRAWKTALKKAGLADRKGLVFHSMRHTFATAYLENGAAITDLQGLLGHKSITTTQIYAAMVDKRARASLEALEFGLGEAEVPDQQATAKA